MRVHQIWQDSTGSVDLYLKNGDSMAKNLLTEASIEKWETKNGESVRIVTRDRKGRFYDNISMAELIK